MQWALVKLFFTVDFILQGNAMFLIISQCAEQALEYG